MNTTSKIASLPRELRIKLNRRLDNGHPTREILEWLNRDKTVRKILAAQFDSEPISRQNLSAWRTGGYQEWTNRRDAIELMKEVSGDADDIFTEVSSGNDSPCFSDKMALWYTARYLVLAKKVIAAAEEGDLDKQEAAMHRIGRQLAHLRRADHSAARIRLQRDRFEFQQTQAAEAREARDAKSKPAKPKAPDPFHAEKMHRVCQALFGENVAPNEEFMKTETYKKEKAEREKRQAAASAVKAAQSKSDATEVQNPSPSGPGNLNPEAAPSGQIQPETSNPKPETAPEFPPQSLANIESQKICFGWTELHEAVEIGRKDIVESLIAGGSEISPRNIHLHTPLHIAAMHGHKEIAGILIAANAEVNAIAALGWTPLDEAIYAGHTELVELLTRHGGVTNINHSFDEELRTRNASLEPASALS